MKTYIQIGSNVGGDDFRNRIAQLTEPSIIHLIEPNISLHEQLRSSYVDMAKHEIHIHNFGISTETCAVTLNIYTDNGLSSLLNRRSYQNKTNEIQIECKSFSDFCKEQQITDIELLWIDTEGLDYEIVNSIDLSLVSINEIIFEKWPFENDDLNNRFRTDEQLLNEIMNKMNGYSYDMFIAFDGLANHHFKKITDQ